MNTLKRMHLPALLAAALLLSPGALLAQDHQAAVWAGHEVDFQYMGFTSRYSCNGLQDDVRDILLRLGAQEGQFSIATTTCGRSPDHPSRVAGVHIKVSTLRAVASGTAGPAVDAYWKPVSVGGASAGDVDCDLLKQVKQQILPLFTIRNVQGQDFVCLPNQPTIIPPRVTLEVLTQASPAS